MLLGVDIGGTKCALVLAEKDGTIRDKVRFATDGKEKTLKRLLAEAKRLAKTHPVSAVGVSCGGPLDARRGLILSPPNLPGWDEVPITALLSEAVGAPARLCNDANACALAEWRFGAGRGCENMIFLTFGTGLGAGLIVDGRLLEGSGGNAGEAGHIRLSRTGPTGYGKAGSFEGFCSGGGIARMAEEAARKAQKRGVTVPWAGEITAKTVGDAAEAGDPTALAVYRRSARKLGEGLAILADLFDPERIIIGSVFARSEGLFRPEMERVFRREALCPERVEILPAALGERLGDVAAVSVALDCEKKENGYV